MRLLKYKVTNFRSVKDSDWIKADDITALIGVNESGKTNLLLPLWKLNPSQEGEGEIEYLEDFPKPAFTAIRANKNKYSFIEAVFKLTEEEQKKLSSTPFNKIKEEPPLDRVETTNSEDEETQANQEESPQNIEVIKTQEDPPLQWADEITVLRFYDGHYEITDGKNINLVIDESAEENSPLAQTFLKILPHFVYYSNYGNLDSAINLEEAVKDLDRLPSIDPASNKAAKIRTLKTLFKFVGLNPSEIASLGKKEPDILIKTEIQTQSQRINQWNQEIGSPTITKTENLPDKTVKSPADEETAKRLEQEKRERYELISSAAIQLTQKFTEWWKQGNYIFKFDVDDNFFRVRVSDDKRKWDVELENRSTGLQWFFSFFLTFLTAMNEEHKNTILLLDEPGLTLHPLAQRDLTAFFKNLAQENQLFYTSHSPFLIDGDRLDRVYKVYSDKDGYTIATSNLRESTKKEEKGASYAVYSAIGLTVSESLLLGCQIVLVEGVSDQFYLSAIKNFLIKKGKIQPSRELVFPPCGGCKTIRPVVSLLLGRDGETNLPYVILDGDKQGNETMSALQQDYKEQKDRLISLKMILPTIDSPEIEDLFPQELLSQEFSKVVREHGDQDLEDFLEEGKSFTSQVENWAKAENINLPVGWKVSLAKRVKEKFFAKKPPKLSDEIITIWQELFKKFLEASEEKKKNN